MPFSRFPMGGYERVEEEASIDLFELEDEAAEEASVARVDSGAGTQGLKRKTKNFSEKAMQKLEENSERNVDEEREQLGCRSCAYYMSENKEEMAEMDRVYDIEFGISGCLNILGAWAAPCLYTYAIRTKMDRHGRGDNSKNAQETSGLVYTGFIETTFCLTTLGTGYCANPIGWSVYAAWIAKIRNDMRAQIRAQVDGPDDDFDKSKTMGSFPSDYGLGCLYPLALIKMNKQADRLGEYVKRKDTRRDAHKVLWLPEDDYQQYLAKNQVNLDQGAPGAEDMW